MEPEVRPAASREELADALFGIGQYFGPRATDEQLDRWLTVFRQERMHAAHVDGRIVGGAGAFDFELSVPGGRMPCAGVTVVGVYPTHRRRGVLRAMMRAQLDDVRERGEPIAALWASEERIYTRFGYGLASWAGEVRLARDRAGFALPFEREGSARFVDADEALALFPPVWAALMVERPGMFARSEDWWRLRRLREPEGQEGGPKRFVVVECGGAPEAYALFRMHPKWDEGVSQARLEVIEAIGSTPRGTRELWRFLLDVDWMGTIEASLLPPDHPLFLLLAEPRRAGYRMGDGLWVRLVDVGAALSGRGYAGDGRVVFEVSDDFCPWNEGRWRLEGGQASRSDEEPEIRLDVRDLGSVFLGGVTFRELRGALRIEELVPGAVERADGLFRPSAAPWCPEIF